MDFFFFSIYDISVWNKQNMKTLELLRSAARVHPDLSSAPARLNRRIDTDADVQNGGPSPSYKSRRATSYRADGP